MFRKNCNCFPKGFPKPKYFFGQWVEYHTITRNAGEELIAKKYVGFVVGISYELPSRFEASPGWRYKLAGIHNNGKFYWVEHNCAESVLTPIDRQPLTPEQFQKLLIPQLEAHNSTEITDEYSEEISFNFRGWSCCVRHVEAGWLSLIGQKGKNLIPLDNPFPTPVEAVNHVLKLVLRMAPSTAISGWLYDLYCWGQLGRTEYESLHGSFHQGM